jgi:hypothetical protein
MSSKPLLSSLSFLSSAGEGLLAAAWEVPEPCLALGFFLAVLLAE